MAANVDGVPATHGAVSPRPVIEAGEVAEVLLATAAVSGVERLWFVSGSEMACFQEAAAKARALGRPAPAIMTMTHEHVGLSVAMGESMVSGRPVATAAHADLGLLHHGGALHNAFRGGYPALIMSGYPATRREERVQPVFWRQQRWDQGSVVRQYVRWDHKLTPYDNVSEVVARALQVALSPPGGPVYLAVPAEVGRWRLDREVPITSAARLGLARLGPGPADAVAEVADRLLAAERPLVVTDRVGRSPAAVRLLDTIAREFALAVQATRHRLNLPDGHPSLRTGTRPADADAVLVLDHLIPWVPARSEPREDAFIAVVGNDPLGADTPVYEFRADVRVVADTAEFLAALLEELRRRSDAGRRDRAAARWRAFETAAARADAARAARLDAQLQAGLITPELLSEAIGEVVDPEDVVTWELADTSGIPRTLPGTLFDKGGSSLGWGVAAAAGARVNDRARPAVCTTGDGSYMFGSPESLLWTQLQYDIPVLTVISNNRGYRTGTTTLVEQYPDGYAARAGDLTGGRFAPPPDFAAQAAALGAFGRKVTRLAELPATLKEARKAVEADRRPAVVDVWLPEHVTGAHPER